MDGGFFLLGKPPTRGGGKVEVWTFEKTLEVSEVVTRFYQKSPYSTSKKKGTFHLPHGDLSGYNTLIDPTLAPSPASLIGRWLVFVQSDWPPLAGAGSMMTRTVS